MKLRTDGIAQHNPDQAKADHNTDRLQRMQQHRNDDAGYEGGHDAPFIAMANPQ
ncbi:hypothetical protein SDC9_148975 [bioreactor metagenome]|uniref:Uncharacterized protein n=1 Tax=bioreactor metagenome TaxID=1076179 RepID=A0A645EML4_9ZZZZ